MSRFTWTTLSMGLIAAAFAVGCEDDFEGACQHYAQAFCTKYAECYPSFSAYLGDPDTCGDRFGYSCAGYMELDGVLASDSDLDECASVIEQTSCDALSNALVVQCIPLLEGEKGDGEPCASGLQCQGGICDKEGDCGVCATWPGEGEPCPDGRCNIGLVCGSDMTCRQMTFHGLGEACGTPDVGFCSPSLRCQGGVCVERLGQGETCSSSGECSSSLTCDMSNTCQPLPPPAAVGEPCGSGYVQCDANGYCDEGMCKARAQDGAVCSKSSECLLAASCIDGRCTLEPPVCE